MFRRLLILLFASVPVMANDALFLQKAVEFAPSSLFQAMKVYMAASAGERDSFQITAPKKPGRKVPKNGPVPHIEDQKEDACDHVSKAQEYKKEEPKIDLCESLKSLHADLIGKLHNSDEYHREIKELIYLYALGRNVARLSYYEVSKLLSPANTWSETGQHSAAQHNIQILEAADAVASVLEEECPDINLTTLLEPPPENEQGSARKLTQMVHMEHRRGTALCWYYLHNGKCARAKCWFSHSLRKLREKQPGYKMEYCGQEELGEQCDYRNCDFMHRGEECLIERIAQQEGILYTAPRRAKVWKLSIESAKK